MPPPAPAQRATLQAVVAMCAAMALFVVNDTLVKRTTAMLAAGEIMALRGVFATFFIGLILLARGALTDFRRLWHPLVMVRGLLEGVIALCFITALARMTIADITAILLTSPLIITAASALLLGETVRWRRWAAVIVGFLGMLMVAKPGGAGSTDMPAIALAVLSALGVAARDLLTRRIPPTVPSLPLGLVTTIVTTLTGLALILAGTGSVERLARLGPTTLAMLIGAGAAVAAGNIAIIMAFRGGDVSIVSPFRYTVMVWAVIAGAAVFGEWPDLLSIIGISLIVGSGLYTLARERRRLADGPDGARPRPNLQRGHVN